MDVCKKASEIATQICLERIREVTWQPFMPAYVRRECVIASLELYVKCVEEVKLKQ